MFTILPGHYQAGHYAVEPDWSSASYWYGMASLATQCTIELNHLALPSLQGDAVVAQLYTDLGVTTTQQEAGIVLSKVAHHQVEPVQLDATHFPDLAQTLAVSCAGLGIPCKMSGLHTLRIKETDRITALETEFKKLGLQVETGEETIALKGPPADKGTAIETYGDHRMAMAFAPLALKLPHVDILDAEVVAKSYPNFWEHLGLAGFELAKI